MYLVTDQAWVVAANADTGEVVWTTKLDYETAAYGGGAVGAPSVDRNRVYVTVNRAGAPFVTALDRLTGSPQWTTVIDTGAGAFAYAQPLLVDKLVFVPFGGDQASRDSSGGWTIMRASTGEVVRRQHLISELERSEGYAGASIWATPAYDRDTGHVYVGTANPAPGGRDHRHTNSIIKIDLDQRRPTFGQLVGASKGTDDTYVGDLDEQPVCENAPESFYPVSAVPCLHLDLDFGASPNLFEVDGRLRVGELQKAGVYHVADTQTMEPVWSTAIAPPCFPCNASTSAVADDRIFAVGSPPGHLVAMDVRGGDILWIHPILDGDHYQSVSEANGVVYTYDGTTLHGVDATNGVPVLRTVLAAPGTLGLPTPQDPGSAASNPAVAGALGTSSSGIAIARNTVYVATGPKVVALTLPAG